MTDILNLSYHTRRLIILALNSSKTKAEARRKTGLSERTFFNLLKEYEIFKGKDGYYSDKQIEYKIIKVYESGTTNPHRIPGEGVRTTEVR